MDPSGSKHRALHHLDWSFATAEDPVGYLNRASQPDRPANCRFGQFPCSRARINRREPVWRKYSIGSGHLDRYLFAAAVVAGWSLGRLSGPSLPDKPLAISDHDLLSYGILDRPADC